jgi:hypothetical protein
VIAAAANARCHRAHRNAQHFGDLVRGKLFQLEQDEGFAHLRRHRVENVSQHRARAFFVERVVGT